ncbi:MAG: hypothetical protein BWY17_04949 [Deltaproteobacteria bacterium ADurb.Bin207]|nr:MAG: hypothetical protein BWY17_04949 [Deltaproteobacteria bacterium ADurb.Bin207]
MAEPAAETNWPALQLVHGVQLAALVVVLYEPLAQAVHTRLAVVEPGVETYWPALQVVHGVQLLALVVVL